MKILILGGEGMLGHKVFQVLNRRFETLATFQDQRGLWTKLPLYEKADQKFLLGGVNALDFDSVVRAMGQVKPGAVINCIGIIKQLKEASDPIISLTLNSLFPHRLAELCAIAGSRLFHISTDCVFSGQKGNYSEDDAADAGVDELRLRALAGRHPDLNRNGIDDTIEILSGRAKDENHDGVIDEFQKRRPQ